MPTIVTAGSSKEKSFFSLLPYRIVNDTIGEEAVRIYRLSGCYRPFFKNIIKRLQKKHPELLLSEELRITGEAAVNWIFPKMEEILRLIYRGTPQKFVILCEGEENRLFPLLKTVSPFAQSVALVTPDASLAEKLSQKALEEFGLTLNHRDILKLDGAELVIFLSGEFDLSCLRQGYLINLSHKAVASSLPTLRDFGSREVSSFLGRHPYLHLKHCLLLPENTPVTELIWK